MKKYYYLSDIQKIDITTTTLLFCIFIGFLRPLILGDPFSAQIIMAYTIMFFVWYGYTILYSNAFNYDNVYNKLINI
jgi:hypothetical protein